MKIKNVVLLCFVSLACLLPVSSVVAQVNSRRPSLTAPAASAAVTQLKDVKIEHRIGQKAESSIITSGTKKRVPANSAYYLRPKGTMYCNWDKTARGYIMPYVNTKPYDTVTWRNMSTTNGSPSWSYFLWNVNLGTRDSLWSSDYDLTVRYGYEYEGVPILTMGSSQYGLTGYKVNSSTGAVESSYRSGIISCPNTQEINSGLSSNLLASAHYYGSSNRFGTEAYGWTFYNGAEGPDGEGDRSGYWFGKNYSGYNVFGGGFEKPVSPYLLNKVYFYATRIAVTEDVDLECRVYRLSDLPAYVDEEQAQIDPSELNAESLIATGRTTITTAMNEAGWGLLEFSLYEADPSSGVERETVPEINDAIVVLILGMDQDEIQNITGLITCDSEDEGVGEVTFLGHSEDGEITALRGLNYFFSSGELKAGSSVLLDVTRPFVTFNRTFEDGEYTFPSTGGRLVKTVGGENYEGIEFYTTNSKSEWTVTDVYGNSIPDWLIITLSDEVSDGEWTGIVKADVVADPVPAGLSGRKAVVRFSFKGAYIDYTFVQGGAEELFGDLNGDGVVDNLDYNLLVTCIANARYISQYDLDGNGDVDVLDANLLLDTIEPQQSLDGQIVLERKYMVRSLGDYTWSSWGPSDSFAYQNLYISFDNGKALEIKYLNANYWHDGLGDQRCGVYIFSKDEQEEWYIEPRQDGTWITERIEIDSNGKVRYYSNGVLMGEKTFEMLDLNGATNVSVNVNPYGWWYTHYHYMDDFKITTPVTVVSDNFNDGVLDLNIWESPVNPDGVREEDGIMKTEQLRTDQDFVLRSKPIPLAL